MLRIAAGILAACLLTSPALAEDPKPKDTRVFELRVYTAAAGKLDELHARFRDHTVKLFAKHGLTNIGYWVPVENKDSKLYYIIAAPTREARDKSFSDFGKDPEWQAAYKASEANGKLVDKIESTFFTAADYADVIKPTAKGAPRLFELRTYKTLPGKLPDLNARFREHTVKLMSNHKIASVAYWLPTDPKTAETTLLCLVAHKDDETAKKAWDAFHADPKWIAVKAETEKNGKIIDKVEAVYMKATDYSPMK